MITKIIFLSSLFLLLVSYSGAQQTDSTLTLENLVQEMLANNPELQSYYHRWQASASRISPAGALPDPVIGIGVMNLPVDNFSFNQEPMTGKQISLMQQFPFPGKQGTRQKIAEMESEKNRLNFLERQNGLIKDLKYAYFDLFYIDKALETNQINQALLKQTLQVVETRYRVGQGLQQDVIRTQLELSRLIDAQLKWEQERISIESRINFFLNRPVKSSLGKTHSLTLIDFEFDEEELDSLANAHNPSLLAWDTFIDQSELETRLAKKEYLPDFGLELAYTQREVLRNGSGGVDFFSGMLNISVPLYFWQKQKNTVEESHLNKVAIQEGYKGELEMIRQQIFKTYSEIKKSRDRAQLYAKNIVPQARQSLQSALSAYQVDKLEYINVIDNQIGLIEYELEYYHLLSNYYKNIAELEMLVGINLTE